MQILDLILFMFWPLKGRTSPSSIMNTTEKIAMCQNSLNSHRQNKKHSRVPKRECIDKIAKLMPGCDPRPGPEAFYTLFLGKENLMTGIFIMYRPVAPNL